MCAKGDTNVAKIPFQRSPKATKTAVSCLKSILSILHLPIEIYQPLTDFIFMHLFFQSSIDFFS